MLLEHVWKNTLFETIYLIFLKLKVRKTTFPIEKKIKDIIHFSTSDI